MLYAVAAMGASRAAHRNSPAPSTGIRPAGRRSDRRTRAVKATERRSRP